MKFLFKSVLILVLFSSCSRIDSIKWDITPNEWIETHSYVEMMFSGESVIISEPSSSIIVFLLGFILTISGIKLLKNQKESKSRKYWGIGLIIWGISTFFAGISYQAFSYILKCEGRDISLWTTWWELWYLILFVISMNVIAVAVAFSSSNGKSRRNIIIYTIINSFLYLLVLISGSIIPNKFMISFECMVLFVGPTFIFLLIFNLYQYSKTKYILEKKLAQAWIFMFVAVIAYFSFLISGYSEVLWTNGIWFNSNDVLHLGLILWVIFYMFSVQKHIKDK